MEFHLQSSLTPEERAQWDRFMEETPHAPPSQRADWADFQQAATGREPRYLIGKVDGRWRVAGLLFLRHWPKPLASYVTVEIPGGPIFLTLADFKETWQFLDRWAASQTVRMTLSPRWPVHHFEEFAEIGRRLGFRPVDHPDNSLYAEETAVVNLRPPLDEILMSFRYQTRYDIRRAEKAHVEVSVGNDPERMNVFLDLLGRRSPRGPGAVADPHLFQKMMTHVLRRPENGIIAIASHNGTPLSAAVYLRNGPFCRFEYGVSDELRKEEVDTSHLLHWKVMAYMKASGCDVLDVGGAAPTLPQDHPGYGVNIFKTGFTKHFLKYTPDFTKCYRPGLDLLQRIRGGLLRVASRL